MKFQINKAKIIKTFKAVFAKSLLIFAVLSMSSLGTQNPLSNFENAVKNCMQKEKCNVVIDFKNNDGNIEQGLGDGLLDTAKRKLYSWGVSSLYNKNFSILVSLGDTSQNYNLSILESSPKPFDSQYDVIQGYLPITYSHSSKIFDRTSSYSELELNHDAVYIPAFLAEKIISDFGFSDYEELISYEEKESDLSIELHFDGQIKKIVFGGVYSNSESQLADDLYYIGQKENPVALCSLDLFNSFKLNFNELLSFVKYTYQNGGNEQISLYFNVLNMIHDQTKCDFNFEYTSNEYARELLTGKLNSFNNSIFNRFGFIFIVIASLIFIGIICLTFFDTKIRILLLDNNKYILILESIAAMAVSALFARLISAAMLVNCISLLSNKGLFITLILFTVLTACSIYLPSAAVKTNIISKKKVMDKNYYEIEC